MIFGNTIQRKHTTFPVSVNSKYEVGSTDFEILCDSDMDALGHAGREAQERWRKPASGGCAALAGRWAGLWALGLTGELERPLAGSNRDCTGFCRPRNSGKGKGTEARARGRPRAGWPPAPRCAAGHLPCPWLLQHPELQSGLQQGLEAGHGKGVGRGPGVGGGAWRRPGRGRGRG